MPKNLRPLLASAAVLAGSAHAKEPAPFPEIMAITGRTQGWINPVHFRRASQPQRITGRTQGWINPVKNRCHILRVQRADFPNSDGSDLRKAFQEAAATRP